MKSLAKASQRASTNPGIRSGPSKGGVNDKPTWELPKMETEQDVADVLDKVEKALQKELPGGKITKIKIE